MSLCPPREGLERLLAEQLDGPERDAVEVHVEACAACQRLLARLAEDADGAEGLGQPSSAGAPAKPGPEFLLRLQQAPPPWTQCRQGDAHNATAAYPVPPTGPGSPARPGRTDPSARPPGDSIFGRLPPPPPDEVPAAALPGAATPPIVPGYEVLRELGRGGMGVVYLARHLRLDRLVALKMILAGFTAGPEERARFRKEAEAVAHLQHPNIVQVYEVGEAGGRPYLALEHVDGDSLARKLAGTPLPARQAAGLMETLARAIHVAHQQAIVHRDLNPANVLLTSAGVPKVTDFGLAKRLDGGAALQTQSGVIVGTPPYMAPEQAAGKSKETGPATDVYALGAILYETLTGRPPFRAETPLETLLQVQFQEPVPPSRLQPKVPRDLGTVCLKCLEKEPRRRYASAGDLADDLQRFLEDKPVRARPVGQAGRLWRWCRRKPTVASLTAAVVALLVAAAVGATVVAFRTASRAAADAVLAEKNRQELVRLQVGKGAALMDEGDLPGALLWFAEAFRLDEGDPGRQEAHRVRLAAVLQQCPKLAQVYFHRGPVNHAEFSPDGRRVLTASDDGTARLWDVSTGDPVALPLEHTGAVLFGAFDHNGRRVLTASQDGTARVWEASTGRPLTPPVGHGGEVTYASFSPGGRRVVTASEDGTARLWDAATGEPTAVLKHRRPVVYASFSPDGRRIVTASGDQTAQVWEAATGRPLLASPLKHNAPVLHASFNADGSRVVTVSSNGTTRFWNAGSGELVTSFLKLSRVSSSSLSPTLVSTCFSPDGRRMVSTTWDPTARVWDVTTGLPLTPPLRHHAVVRGAGFSPDGQQVVTASDDGTVRVWDAVTGEPATPPLGHSAGVVQASFSPDGRQAVTACRDGTARVWDLTGGRAVPWQITHTYEVWDVAFSPDGRRVATASKGTARVWDADTGEPVTPPLRHAATLWRVLFSPDGRRVATACEGGTARVWDAATGAPVTEPLKHARRVRSVAFSPDGRSLVSASSDGTASVWELATGERVLNLELGAPGRNAAFSPDGRRLVTACSQLGRGELRVRDAATGRPLTPPLRHEGTVASSAAFSPDGRRLLSASDDQTARVWDAETGRLIQTLKHGSPVYQAAFSPDGRLVVTAGHDQLAQVWDAATGKPVLPPFKHRDVVRGASFSPDGRRVLTAGQRRDNAARVWDAATGEPLTPPLKHWGTEVHACFSPDGRRVLTGSGDGTNGMARMYRLRREELSVQDLTLLAQLLTGHRIDSAVGSVPLEPTEFQAAWQALRPKYPGYFAASPEEIAAWQRQETETRAQERISRGHDHAVPGEWDGAAACFAGAIEVKGAPLGAWHCHALLRLHFGDLEGYRRACAGILERFGDAEDPDTIKLVAQTCVLAPDAVADLPRPVQLAERLAADHSNEPQYLFELGAALYRAGRFEAAVRQLDKASKARDSLGKRGDAPDSPPYEWLFLAMANQRLGQPGAARQWLDRAVRWLDEHDEEHWTNRVICQRLRDEAEALMRGTTAGPR
jgi:WD40 repeat protein/tetratricopeptide (TPR) repeat protein/predicted Ser/Thr protein kinase